MIKKLWIVVPVWALMACAHQSKIEPSTGHIDGQSGQSQPIAAQALSIPKPVKNNIYVPPPKPKAKEQTYSVVVNEVPVKEILFALARESKLNVDIHPSIDGKVTLNAVDQTLPAILERLSKQVDLTYKVEGNVLSITPDLPVLRTYKVDYVNMSRDTTGFIGAAAEIASTGRAASAGAAGATGSSGASGGATGGTAAGATNSSRTSVSSISKNHLWENLIENIKDLLKETDKEVMISRTGSVSSQSTNAAQTSNTNQNSPAGGLLNSLGAAANNAQANNNAGSDSRSLQQQRDDTRAEYTTLYAAKVISNPETGVISVRATNKQHEKVQEFLDKVMSSAKRQVLIEATIVEVQLSDTFQSGIDWSRLNNSASNSGFVFSQSLGPGASLGSTGAPTGFAQNQFGNTPSSGFVAGYLNPLSAIGNIAASITLLKQFGNTKVLSSPKLMVLNNQTAVLKVVNNLVYFTVQADTTQSTNNTLTTITTTPNTVPVGMVMSVTPQVAETGEVNINVRPTISRVLSFITDPNPSLRIQSQIPQIQVREMESILQVRSGSTAILGGLMQDEIFRTSDTVPGLNQIPLLGRVFNGRNDATRKTELVVFLRPTVVKNASLESDELQTFKQYLPAQQLQQQIDESPN